MNAQEFVDRGVNAQGRWVRHALTYPCGCAPEAPACANGLALFDLAKAEELVCHAPEALLALGEARDRLETAIRNDPGRAAKGSVQNRTGLGGALHHVEFAIAELIESLRPEEWAHVGNESEGTAREPADGTAAPPGT
jgi:hypothetical protein